MQSRITPSQCFQISLAEENLKTLDLLRYVHNDLFLCQCCGVIMQHTRCCGIRAHGHTSGRPRVYDAAPVAASSTAPGVEAAGRTPSGAVIISRLLSTVLPNCAGWVWPSKLRPLPLKVTHASELVTQRFRGQRGQGAHCCCCFFLTLSEQNYYRNTALNTSVSFVPTRGLIMFENWFYRSSGLDGTQPPLQPSYSTKLSEEQHLTSCDTHV